MYVTDSIAYIPVKEDPPFNKWHVVASDQELHTRQLFKIVELTGYKQLQAKILHISF
jgi:arginyl-tRNA synthetase